MKRLLTHIGRPYLAAQLILFVGLGPVPSFGQAATPALSVLDDAFVRDAAKRGLDHLYNMEIEAALEIFDQIDRRYPNHPIGPFLKGLLPWWNILLDLSETTHDPDFYAAMEEVIRRCDVMLGVNERDLDAMFFKGAALGLRGRHRSNRDEWWKAAKDGRGAMNYVLDVARIDTTNADFIFGKGVYDYFAYAVPKKYPVARPLMVFFPKGDRERGLAGIMRTAEEGYYIKTEATYFLLQIYFFYERDYRKSLEYSTQLRKQYPGNPFFHVIQGTILVTLGRLSEGEDELKEVLVRHNEGRSGYVPAIAEQALYYLARISMVRRAYDDALDYLFKLDNMAARNDQQTYFKVMGKLRQGMVYDAQGRRREAVRLYQDVLMMKEQGQSHARARRYLDKPYRR